ncbi:hypothetical protein J2752_000490 [Halarchaeum rubridurum]|uniref:Uncharacterized protein n=1 Tax=Halarchaeum rubridurum TaxID=489911 RepID=A0A8T4GLS4_9EURY|nr:hypothetical protein [Halarchaeum rubridurum]MBP1953609.1 hypothetical protein [Halarchaeum rubridurum]
MPTGSVKKREHWDEDCPAFKSTSTPAARDAATVPEGYYEFCKRCTPAADEGGDA